MDENIDFDADEFDEQFQEYFEMNEDELIDPKRVAKTSGSGIDLETWFENDGTVQVVLFTDSSEKEKELDLAKMIDHTLLKPDATSEDIEKLCEEAGEYGFATVCVNPSNVSYCVELLNETEVGVCTVIGFPLGANETSVKVEEAKIALENGATEIDMVMNIGALKSGAFDYVADDIHRVVLMGLIHGATVKVIIETALLTREEKIKACLIAKAMGAHFVKTSTGFSKGGATEEDIRLMRETVGPEMGVKASGGVRSREDALKMINAGATRIGASSGIAIVGGKKGNNEGY